MSPPSVEQEAEEEGHDEAGVKAMRVGIEDAVSLEGTGSPPQSAVGGQLASLGNEP